jgi:Xaa-Pro aminopeptidase
MWPKRSSPDAFRLRRERLGTLLGGQPAILASGFARPRNFPDNTYPFRAESHFLYLVGLSLQGAALLVEGNRTVLYMQPKPPEEALWTGPSPSFEDIAAERGLVVEPIDQLEIGPEVATLPPQDADTALWLSTFLGRSVDPGGGDEVEGIDAALADAMIDLRLRHDEAAIEQLVQASRVTGLAHRAGMRATRAGLREAVVRAAMEQPIVESGMCCAYAPIVTVRGEVLHNQAYDNILTGGDLLLADVGAETPEGWASDVTRTWPVDGRFSAEQRALYEVVLAAQEAAISAVRPKTRFRDVHRAAGRRLVEGLVDIGILQGRADDLFERGAAALFFPHGVGHLLGLDVHDLEDLGDRAGYAPGRSRSNAPGERYLRLDRDLETNMVVTIEPGFYLIDSVLRESEALHDAIDRSRLERFLAVRGIRIEDDVQVTETGSTVLTNDIPKSVEDVEAIMRG